MPCNHQGNLVFPKRQHERDIILCKSVMKRDPVLDRPGPLTDDGVPIFGKLAFQTLLNKSSEIGERLRKWCDEAVRKRHTHRLRKQLLHLFPASQYVAGKCGDHTKIDTG